MEICYEAAAGDMNFENWPDLGSDSISADF